MAWSAIMEKDFMSGGFTWTGWDYKGEPTPYAWPDINSHFGIIDIAGFWKDRTYMQRDSNSQYPDPRACPSIRRFTVRISL